MSEKTLTVTVMRCSRCNARLIVIESTRMKRCDNCGAAYRLKGGKWIGDADRWETKDGWQRVDQ